jgi:hypothetical protein
LTYKIICGECGELLYSGYDLKSTRDVLKPSEGKCKKCGDILSQNDFNIEITSKFI